MPALVDDGHARHRLLAAPAVWSALARPALTALVAMVLIAAVAGGLVRAGIAIPDGVGVVIRARAALDHAALMLCGFLGTVIAVERAVALRHRAAFVAPVASLVAAVAMLAGEPSISGGLWVFAGLAFTGVTGAIVRRQAAAHTVLLLVGAVAWLAGNLLFAAGAGAPAVLPWWFAFPVLTIAAERLEMTRLMRRHGLAQPSLHAIVALLLAAAAASALRPAWGGVAYGAALVALAVWLARFDIARRTAHGHGLSRYMALCLLGGYVWLGVAGAGWAATALGLPARDLALHGLGLGFIFSMVMGHAPVILPAVARVKLLFGRWFYAPLALLHASLLLRLAGGLAQAELQRSGTALNAAALALFMLTIAGSALAWRVREAAHLSPKGR
jgi:hypothetical protein